MYLRNLNTQGNADIRFFFGNPGDIPLAGDFNAGGCDTVSIYRPSEARIFVINELGTNDGGLGAADYDFYFGNPGDKPFVGDFNINGQDTVGLHRESTGFVYYRNTLTTGIADNDRLGKGFVALSRAAGLRTITIRQLRHSHATALLAAGESPKVVQERLGHSSISVTLDVYSAVLPNMQREAVERLAEMFDA